MGKIWVNGLWVPISRAMVSVRSYVVNYCSSVFEGIRVYDLLDGAGTPTGERAVWLLREHIDRLYESASHPTFGMDTPFDREELVRACLQVVAANPGTDYLRPIVFRNLNPELGHAIGVNSHGVEITVVIAPIVMGQYLKKGRHHDGVTAFVTDVIRPRKHYPGQVKGGPNYGLYSEPACRQATAAGAGEAILQGEDDDGRRYLVDGPGANLFVILGNGIVVTPDTKHWNVLGGKTRAFILDEVLPLLGIEAVVAERLALSDFRMAHEAFFSGTAIEVDPITGEVTMDNGQSVLHEIGDGYAGPITRSIKRVVSGATHGRDDRFRHHLTVVSSSTVVSV